MIQSDPPKLEWPWLQRALEPLLAWVKSRQVFSSDRSIRIEERPGGLDIGVPFNELDGGTDPQPLRLIAANVTDENGTVTAPRIRVVKGGIQADAFFYASTDMSPIEDGTEDNPYTYVTEFADGDSIYLDLAVSFDDVFWRCDSISIHAAASVPVATDDHAYFLLGTVRKNGNTASVATPQMHIGNYAWRRSGTAGNVWDEFWPA